MGDENNNGVKVGTDIDNLWDEIVSTYPCKDFFDEAQEGGYVYYDMYVHDITLRYENTPRRQE